MDEDPADYSGDLKGEATDDDKEVYEEQQEDAKEIMEGDGAARFTVLNTLHRPAQ